MDIIVAIIVGGVVGWLASLVMRTDEQQGTLANVIVGIIGALLARFIFFNLLGIGSAAAAGTLSLFGLLWGVVGAVVLIAVLKWVNVLR